MERQISGRNEEWSEEWKKVLAMLPKQINLTEGMTYIRTVYVYHMGQPNTPCR